METSRIKHVSIEKLWGIKTISTDLFENVNIFIGANGSSKTTFLSLIEAALLVDLNVLGSIDFERILISFEGSTIQYLQITKELSDDIPEVHYQFDNGVIYDLPCTESYGRLYRISNKFRESLIEVKRVLSSAIAISWLSVNRGDAASSEYERSSGSDRLKNMVDAKLQELVRNLVLFQLQLESEANNASNTFKEDVLSLMLYNEEFDSYKSDWIERFASTDTESMQTALNNAFSAMRLSQNKKQAIKKHIQSIKSVVEKIKASQKIDLNDAFVLALINRTFSIIDISKKHETQTKSIFLPMDNFKTCLNRFMPDKEFVFNQENSGEYRVLLKGERAKDVSLEITSLSSGEKQLFILLSEALLQREKPYIFIADEPELSLHIGWQKRILGELLKLNPQAQIIVATHSPEIAGNFPDNVINMSSIVSYE